MERPVLCAESDVPSHALKRDLLQGALTELFYIEHPEVKKNDPTAETKLSAFLANSNERGIWVYYAAQNLALHIPSEDTYFRLRTARNRNLIRESEQVRYRASHVGVAGLSVGSTVIASLVATGGPKRMKIADFDTIEITNLNRIRATLLDVTSNKAEVAARNAWELDPFLDLDVWERGLTAETVDAFVKQPRLDVCVDEMDDLALKFLIRKKCKEHKVPVVMATDNGDSVLIDVERYDLEPERPLFHGRVTLSEDELGVVDRARFIELSNQIIDVSLFVPRQWESIQEIGMTLSGVPQLGSAAAIAGAAVAYAVRQITIGAPLQSGRYAFGCEALYAKPISS